MRYIPVVVALVECSDHNEAVCIREQLAALELESMTKWLSLERKGGFYEL